LFLVKRAFNKHPPFEAAEDQEELDDIGGGSNCNIKMILFFPILKLAQSSIVISKLLIIIEKSGRIRVNLMEV